MLSSEFCYAPYRICKSARLIGRHRREPNFSLGTSSLRAMYSPTLPHDAHVFKQVAPRGWHRQQGNPASWAVNGAAILFVLLRVQQQTAAVLRQRAAPRWKEQERRRRRRERGLQLLPVPAHGDRDKIFQREPSPSPQEGERADPARLPAAAQAAHGRRRRRRRGAAGGRDGRRGAYPRPVPRPPGGPGPEDRRAAVVASLQAGRGAGQR